jgi:hypothetical protein
MIAQVASRTLSSAFEATVERVISIVLAGGLVEEFVLSTISDKVPRRRLLQQSLDLWWLAAYARYLVMNRNGQRQLEGRILSSRDLELHRLWPIAGLIRPRIVDLLMCVLLSLPGFIWLVPFLWGRGVLAKVAVIIVSSAWVALLVRTSTKAWVSPATPDWSRIRQPRFLLAQVGAATVLGVVAGFVFSPLIGVVTFITAWLAIGLTVGFGQTLTTDSQVHIMGPTTTLRHERTISRLSAWVVFPLLATGFGAAWGLVGVPIAAAYCLIVGESVASALWRRYLAMIIARPARLPASPKDLFERSCRSGLMRRVGLAYQFRHDDIRDYFARRPAAPFTLLKADGQRKASV